MDWGMILSQFRGIHTLIMIAIFVGICIWAFSPQRRSENDRRRTSSLRTRTLIRALVNSNGEAKTMSSF